MPTPTEEDELSIHLLKSLYNFYFGGKVLRTFHSKNLALKASKQLKTY